jgi:hypothetical protein
VQGSAFGVAITSGAVASGAMPSGPVRRPPQELAFAAAIRAARVGAGRTQADVAEAAGLPVHTLQTPSRAHGVLASARPLPLLRRSVVRSMSWWRCPRRRRSSRPRWAGLGVLMELEPLLAVRGT